MSELYIQQMQLQIQMQINFAEINNTNTKSLKQISSQVIFLSPTSLVEKKQSQKSQIQDQNLDQKEEQKELNYNQLDLKKVKQKIRSNYAEEYNKEKANMASQIVDIKQVYGNLYYFLKIDQLSLSENSKNILLKNYKELEKNHIKICQQFSSEVSVELRDVSQHGQIFYFKFKLNLLNIEEINQNFSQPTIQIGKGGHGQILSYITNTKKYAIKKIKIKNISKNTGEQFYEVKESFFQYCIYKLLSVLQIGLKVSQQAFGFDLICFQDVICFNMEQGTQINMAISSDYNSVNIKSSQIELCQSLFFLHDLHIVHCDIKPQNIMYSPSHNRAVFIDFGISQLISQPQGEMSLFSFKGTYQYCNEQLKKLLLRQQPDFVDLYWSDMCSLRLSLQLITKNSNFANFYSQDSSEDQAQYNEYLREEISQLKHRNFYLQSKLIFLIWQQNQKQIEKFMNSNKVQIIYVLPILLEIHPSIVLFRLYKVFFEHLLQTNDKFDLLKAQIQSIYSSHTFKTVLAYNQTKHKKIGIKFQQTQLLAQQFTQMKARIALQQLIIKFTSQNQILCYFYFLQWLKYINFFIIDQKIISEQTILQIIRTFGRKVFGSISDTKSIHELLLNCLQKIEQIVQSKINSILHSQDDQPQNFAKGMQQQVFMEVRLCTQILQKVGTTFYRIAEFNKCLDSYLKYLKYTNNPKKFFYIIFQVIKLVFLNVNTHTLNIYLHYSQAIGKPRDEQVLQTYRDFSQLYNSQVTILLINLKNKVNYFWCTLATMQEKNLFQSYLQAIKVLFIPRRINFSRFNKLTTQSLNKIKKQTKNLIQKLQNTIIQIPEFYRKKLIVDLYYHHNDTDIHRNSNQIIQVYYMLLQKKYQKYMYDINTQSLMILLANALNNILLLDQSIKIMDNVKQCNIFGKVNQASKITLYYKAMVLQKSSETAQQGERMIINILQKSLEQGYKVLSFGNRDIFMVHSFIKYFCRLVNYEEIKKYYLKIKIFLQQFEPDQKKYYQILMQVFYFTYITAVNLKIYELDQQFQKIMERVQLLNKPQQITDVFWRTKASYQGRKFGNKKRLEVYQQYYKTFQNSHQSQLNIVFYVNSIKIQKNRISQSLKNRQFLKKQHVDILIQQQNQYNNQILSIYKAISSSRNLHYILTPSFQQFHLILNQIFMKTGQYSLITNNFVKITAFIKSLTSLHNSQIYQFYQKLVKIFVCSSFIDYNFKDFLHKSLQLFIDSSDQEIQNKFPQILFYYSTLLHKNRHNKMTSLELKTMKKILKFINYTHNRTKILIKCQLQQMMCHISLQWEIAKNLKFKLKQKKKYYLLKCLRSSKYDSIKKRQFWKEIKTYYKVTNNMQSTQFFDNIIQQKLKKCVYI